MQNCLSEEKSSKDTSGQVTHFNVNLMIVWSDSSELHFEMVLNLSTFLKKTLQCDIIQPLLGCLLSKRGAIRVWRKGNPVHYRWQRKLVQSFVRNSMEAPQEATLELSYDPAHFTCG